MKIIKKTIAALALAALACPVFAAEPSLASIERLLDLMQSRQSYEAIRAQVDAMAKPTFDQAIDSKSMSPEQREAIERRAAARTERMKSILDEAMNWEQIRADTAQIYAESFTQEEIDGLIAFYESPAGKAYTAKMPLIAQKSMALMQRRMGPLMEKISQAAKESVAKIKAK